MSYIWIGSYAVVFLAFLAAIWVEDDAPKTKKRIALLVFVSAIWPMSVLSMIFMRLMGDK